VSDTGATQLRGGPEFIWNTLEVSGPLEARADFLAAASGPGFIDWRPEWYSVYEQIYFAVMAAGAPSQQAARRVAGKLRDRFWREHETRRRAAELDPHRVPLDLNALIPIPEEVLRQGFLPAGQAWIQAHWGVTWPPRDVSFVMEHRRQGRALEPVGVFRFLTEDWSPWIAFAHMRARWPDLCFKVRPSYLEPVVPDGRARGVQENGRGKERRKARRASAGRRLPRQRHAELARELEAAL
jgi:hypothetical protein